MPVRFRCVYCNQLLGISRRKAGAVVRCTNCEGQIIVPEPVQEVQAAASGQRKPTPAKEHERLSSDLFERNDIDDLLKPFDFDSPATPATPPEELTPPSPAPPSASFLVPESPWQSRRMRVTRIAIAWTLTAVLAFILGFVVGRGTVPIQ